MRRTIPAVLLAGLVSGVMLLTVVNIGLVLSTQHRPAINWREAADTGEALGFACGYRAGQIAIMSRMPSVFSKDDIGNPLSGSCPAVRDKAIKHGFATAATD